MTAFQVELSVIIPSGPDSGGVSEEEFLLQEDVQSILDPLASTNFQSQMGANLKSSCGSL